MNEDQRWNRAKAHITKPTTIISPPGLLLKELKAEHDGRGGSWIEWETKMKEKAGIHKSRASELMAIADGTKTAESVVADRRERQRKAKAIAKKKSSVDDGENNQPKSKPSKAQDKRELEAKQAHIAELEAAHEHDQDLAEQLQAAKIVGLEGEIADLKRENARRARRQVIAPASVGPSRAGTQRSASVGATHDQSRHRCHCRPADLIAGLPTAKGRPRMTKPASPIRLRRRGGMKPTAGSPPSRP